MNARRRMAGRPLVAAMAVISGWVAIRASVWEPPFALPAPQSLLASQGASGDDARAFALAPPPYAPPFFKWGRTIGSPQPAGPGKVLRAALPGADYQAPAGAAYRLPALASGRVADAGQFARSQASANHQMLFAAALSFLPSYESLVASGMAGGAPTAPGRGPDTRLAAFQGPVAAISGASMGAQQATAAGTPRPDRWSGDAWLLVREGGRNPALSSVNPASYGANQVGAVVRYELAPNSTLRPNVYARASKALVTGGEAELATGVAINLARSFPLRAHGELRVTDRPGGTEVRPAAYIVTGLPRREVTPGLEADAYLQAGYVGGDFETGFVDGKATLEAPVVRTEQGRIAFGGGVWGGAQRGASRLDVGPTASTILSTGKATIRASVDYRFRVAGDASPGDGLAVTLAASF